MTQDLESTVYQYSVKVERTAKGARWTIHCYNNDKEAVLNEAVQMYQEMGKRLEKEGIQIAPIEKGKE